MNQYNVAEVTPCNFQALALKDNLPASTSALGPHAAVTKSDMKRKRLSHSNQAPSPANVSLNEVIQTKTRPAK